MLCSSSVSRLKTLSPGGGGPDTGGREGVWGGGRGVSGRWVKRGHATALHAVISINRTFGRRGCPGPLGISDI